LNTDRQISGLSHNNFREREEGKHKTKEQRWERECKIAQFNVQKKKTNTKKFYHQKLNSNKNKLTFKNSDFSNAFLSISVFVFSHFLSVQDCQPIRWQSS
jgi:hypothetical protein